MLAPIERVKTIVQTTSISTLKNNTSRISPIAVYTEIATDQGVLQFLRGNMPNVYKYTLQVFLRTMIFERIHAFNSSSDAAANFGKNVAMNTVL